MKKLLYALALILLTGIFTSCSTQDPLEDISVEISSSEKKKTSDPVTSDDVREGDPFE